MISTRTLLTCALMCSMITNLGCASFWYDLQPYRLQRWNQGPAPTLDPEFTQKTTHGSTQLVKQVKSQKKTSLSANQAEVTVISFPLSMNR